MRTATVADVGLARTAQTLVFLGLALCLPPGCIVERPIDEADQSDLQQPEPPPPVPPFGQPVHVVAFYPPDDATDVPRNTPVWIEFDQYLDADLISPSRTLRLRSNGVTASLIVHYEMTHRRVVGRLRRPLESDLRYKLSPDNPLIFAVDGAPLLDNVAISFTTSEAIIDHALTQVPPTWQDVEPLFAAGCGCHRLEAFPETWFTIPALTYDRIVGQPSAQRPELALVDPYRPAHSYLMRKVLDDYPDRDGSAMPPPWAGTTDRTSHLPSRALSRDEIARIEDWIQLGAPR